MNYATIREIMTLVTRFNSYLEPGDERMTFAEMCEILGYEGGGIADGEEREKRIYYLRREGHARCRRSVSPGRL